jgi:hypothetical protein
MFLTKDLHIHWRQGAALSKTENSGSDQKRLRLIAGRICAYHLVGGGSDDRLIIRAGKKCCCRVRSTDKQQLVTKPFKIFTPLWKSEWGG